MAPSPPPPPLGVPKLHGPETHRNTEKDRKLADVRGGGEDALGAKSYDCQKAWSSINHSILSALEHGSVGELADEAEMDRILGLCPVGLHTALT